MKGKVFTIIMMLMLSLGASAQQGQQQQQQASTQRFSPERFEAELQDFITKEAHLTQQEATKFFPVYKEMQEKQRTLFERQRQLSTVKPTDEQGCLKNIKDRDELDLELKRVQQTYHLRFLELLPASKVYDILKAEDRYYRRMMKNWGRTPQSWGRSQGWGNSQRNGGHSRQNGGNSQQQGWPNMRQGWPNMPQNWPNTQRQQQTE